LEQILSAPFPDYDLIQTINPHIYGLFDKEGHPLYVERMGGVDSGSVCKIMNEDFSIMRYIHHQERVLQECRLATARLGRPVSTACGLIDVKGLRSPSFSLFRVCSEMDHSNYPETLHRFYIINTPWIFKGIYAIAEQFLDPVVKSKVVHNRVCYTKASYSSSTTVAVTGTVVLHVRYPCRSESLGPTCHRCWKTLVQTTCRWSTAVPTLGHTTRCTQCQTRSCGLPWDFKRSSFLRVPAKRGSSSVLETGRLLRGRGTPTRTTFR
jgi:hypothetical protein